MDKSSDNKGCTDHSPGPATYDLARWIWASKTCTNRVFWFIAKLLMLVCAIVVIVYLVAGPTGVTLFVVAIGYWARRDRQRR